MKDFIFTTPVLFLIFNRPDTTKRIFEAIRDARPEKLYIAADGPRNREEKEECEQARNVAVQIDWPCEIKTLFREVNLGCRRAVSSALDWFFEQEEEGIILEDDCLPNKDFFQYCQELLQKYRNDPKIMHIGGANFQFGKKHGEGSYYFSNNTHVWGWASWRRAWNLYDVNMNNFPEFRKEKRIKKVFSNKIAQLWWNYVLDRTHKNKIDTWDFQWNFCLFVNEGFAVIPNKNLITNIGFSQGGTNTFSPESIFANIPTAPILPLSHPQKIIKSDNADRYFFKMFFKDALINFIKRKLNRFVSKVFGKFLNAGVSKSK
jgi:hypothetical protein